MIQPVERTTCLPMPISPCSVELFANLQRGSDQGQKKSVATKLTKIHETRQELDCLMSFLFGDDFYFAFGDGGEEFFAVGFCCYSAVQDYHDAGVGFASDQAV